MTLTLPLSGSRRTSQKNMIFPNDDEVFEMYLMSMCDEVIMANSSFSWWGSYLGKEKKTFAPRVVHANSIVKIMKAFIEMIGGFCEYSREKYFITGGNGLVGSCVKGKHGPDHPKLTC